MFTALINACQSFITQVKAQLKKNTKPTTANLAASAVSDLARSKNDLIVENALLRQQLIVLKRQVKRPKFTNGDRVRLTLLSRLTGFWQSALHIVQPETVLRWHRDLFRRYWKLKSKPKSRKPRIPQATVDLIKQMAIENRRWGAKKIHGELLKLGIIVHKRTIQRYLRQVRKRNSCQNWATFLKNHASVMWSCDFTTVHTLFFKPIYILVFLELQTRKIVHTAVTTSPSDAWTAQQLREATAWGEGPQYLIHDNDSKFGKHFSAVAMASNIKELKTPFQAPKANAICERFLGSLKRECLDFHLILNSFHLRRIVNEYVAYYNRSRPHQGIGQAIPNQFDEPRLVQSIKPKGPIIATPVLNGLHHHYAYSGLMQ